MLLQCFACGDTTPARDGLNRCGCRRSTAVVDGAVVELHGPARILVPADDVVTIDGMPWASVPEDPIVVRRAPIAAAA